MGIPEAGFTWIIMLSTVLVYRYCMRKSPMIVKRRSCVGKTKRGKGSKIMAIADRRRQPTRLPGFCSRAILQHYVVGSEQHAISHAFPSGTSHHANAVEQRAVLHPHAA